MASPSDFNTSTLDLDLEQVYVEIDPTLTETVWQQSQGLATAASRWRAYVNGLALRSLLPWIQENVTAARCLPMLKAALWPTVWEWVTGSAVAVGEQRWILMATEALDADELRVPQEWVDSPDWMGDYYLLVQVNVDDGWVKIAGFTSHAQLKGSGEFDGRDRTYSLLANSLLANSLLSETLTTDINLIDLTTALIPNTVTRAAVQPTPHLSSERAHQLIARLSNPTLLNPRLAIDFASWSALLSHGGWRREMSAQRQGNASSFSVGAWLQNGISQVAQQLGWQTISFQPAMAGARGDEENSTAQTALLRAIVINGADYTLEVAPLDSEQPNAWRFTLQKLTGLIPAGVTLSLLTEALQPFENNAATSNEPTESLYVDVALAPDEAIVWAVTPTPEQYEAEILRF